MKVGYISELGITSYKKFEDWLEYLSCKATEMELKFLIIAGGISNDYSLTLDFIDKLARRLRTKSNVRFIPGNTDFYYKEHVVNKKSNFYKLRNLYLTNPYCLVTNPILTTKIRIIGTELWYDYSFYRGNSISLKDITKKSKWFGLFKNDDVKYITDEYDFSVGLENTFDYQYAKQCRRNLVKQLAENEQKYALPVNSVVVSYFYPVRNFLSEGFLDGYFGAFEGQNIEDILGKYYVSEYIVGKQSDKKEFYNNKIVFLNVCNEDKEIIERNYYTQ